MSAKYQIGQTIQWYMGPSLVTDIDMVENKYYYNLKHTQYPLTYRVSEQLLDNYNVRPLYNMKKPHVVIVDNFYQEPELIRQIAMEQIYHPNIKAYKGKRSATRLLLPGLKEQFEKLIGVPIINWTNYGTNGVFQITNYNDPLVWHSDTQNYAAAIYLTPNSPVTAGTSFWRDRKYGCRRSPFHEQEKNRFENDVQRELATQEIYSSYNLVHPDNWELVDRVGSVFNRLVIWDAQIIHSASSYEAFSGQDEISDSRLIQLFFFDIDN